MSVSRPSCYPRALHVRRSAIALLMIAVMRCASAAPVSAEGAMNCGKDCPVFWELYDADARFRAAVDDAIVRAGLKVPIWLKTGTAGPVKTIGILGKTYIAGSVCEPHNCPHHLNVIYWPTQRRALGQYFPEDQAPIWVGDPSEDEKRALQRLEDE